MAAVCLRVGGEGGCSIQHNAKQQHASRGETAKSEKAIAARRRFIVNFTDLYGFA
jgi:hypothetical protein